MSVSLALSGLVRAILSLLTFCFFTTVLFAQGEGRPDPCSGGGLYYVAFPDTIKNMQDARFDADYSEEFFLYIYSPVDQQVRISHEGETPISKNIAAGDILEFDTREIDVPLVAVRNVPQTNALKVESESPVVLYAYMATRFGCAAFTPVPVEAWGREYYAATWKGEYVRDIQPGGGENKYNDSRIVPAPAEILILAAYDETEVVIAPTDSLASCENCNRVTLDAGEAYLVQSFVDTAEANLEIQGDIAGTSIVASKPIGVISGNSRMWHEPLEENLWAGNSYKDMAVEWLTPIEQHGREFIFLPTWDTLAPRPGVGLVRDREYVRVYATTTEPTSIESSLSPGSSATQLNKGEFRHDTLEGVINGIRYRTTEPAQAYQSPRPMTEFVAKTGSGNFIGAAYRSWGTYMVEMTSREQWTSFAPFKAPSYPSGMKHYINVVAERGDSNRIFYRSGKDGLRPFPLTQGSIQNGERNYVWGTMAISPGLNYVIEGEGGARFGGFVYGTWTGYELYRPGGTEKEEASKGRSAASRHPSEYDENVAMMYGYPLVPSRCILERPGDYKVETETTDCGTMTVTIRAADTNAAGLRFVRLVDDSLLNENVRLEFIEPVGGLNEKTVHLVRLRLVPVAPWRDARGVAEFKDHTREGEIRRIEYDYTTEHLEIDPGALDFGSVTVNESAGEQLVMVSNSLDRDMTIRGLGFAAGDQGFVITRTEPGFNWGSGIDSLVLKKGESLKVWINVTPWITDQTFFDSLTINLGCFFFPVPLRVTTIPPCIYVHDLDFGVLKPRQEKTLPLDICNVGEGQITFHDSGSGKEFLSWLLDEFRVSQADMQKLAGAVLGPQECLTIDVSFSSEEPDDVFQTTARFWGNTRNCRDTSVWSARVVIPGPFVAWYAWGEQQVSIFFNACTKNRILFYPQDIQVGNDGSDPFRVERIEIVDNPGRAFEIVSSGNVTPGRMINPSVTETVRVAFRPTVQRAYSARLRLHYTMNGKADSVDGRLEGTGIESCIQISDLDILVDTVTSSERKGSGRFQLRSTGTRPVTLSSLSIGGADASDFSFVGGAPSLPLVIPAGESRELEVLFAPSGTTPTERRAVLSVEGDYAYVDCPGSCSDSSAVLRGVFGTLSVEDVESPAGYAISSISPNPFSREVEIRFTLGKAGMTRADIYNASGSLVTTLLSESLSAGTHRLVWNGTGVAAGLYHIRIRSGKWSASQQLVLVK